MSEREVRRSQISEREARRLLGRAPQARSFLRAKRAARDENVQAKRADFFTYIRRHFGRTEKNYCAALGAIKNYSATMQFSHQTLLYNRYVTIT